MTLTEQEAALLRQHTKLMPKLDGRTVYGRVQLRLLSAGLLTYDRWGRLVISLEGQAALKDKGV